MSRASLERELKVTVPGTAVLAIDDLVRRHGLTAPETEAMLRATGHTYVERAGVPTGCEDDPTIELELDTVAQALSQGDPGWRDEDSGSSPKN
jgi:hypothetical protein